MAAAAAAAAACRGEVEVEFLPCTLKIDGVFLSPPESSSCPIRTQVYISRLATLALSSYSTL